MARQRDNNISPQPPPPATATFPARQRVPYIRPSMPNISLTMYGGTMSITGNPTHRWSHRNGANNMRYIHADSETNFTVKGQLPMSSLNRGHKYRGVFELELTDHAYGWQGDFVVSLEVPGSRRAVEARSYKHDKIGPFKLESRSFELAAAPQRNACLSFNLSHTGPCIRKGLLVKRFVIKQA